MTDQYSREPNGNCGQTKEIYKGYAVSIIRRATVEPRYNEVPRDWQNVFVITRFRYIEVLFHIFYYYSGKQNRSLYRGLRYMEVRYIKVSLYFLSDAM